MVYVFRKLLLSSKCAKIDGTMTAKFLIVYYRIMTHNSTKVYKFGLKLSIHARTKNKKM